MAEFWEEAFKNKHMMWGEQPTIAAFETCEHFKSLGFQKILIPGFGYGRNARPFLDSGFEVTGIEISETAIELAYQLMTYALWPVSPPSHHEHGQGTGSSNDVNPKLPGIAIKLFHGSVNDMPFDQDSYDGIFCHALIHLLRADERKRFLTNCNTQLKSGGLMVFTAITKHAPTYGVGEKLGKDLFKTKDGVELFFYDEVSIQEEFGPLGLVEATIVEEAPATKFWKIVCRKAERL